MLRPQWHYPTTPFHVNQAWGIKNPIYEQFGFSRHNGVDFALGEDTMLYYPWNGTGTVVKTDNIPNGAGIMVRVRSNEEYDFGDRKAYILTDFMHCHTLFVKEGDTVRTGDRLARADNTGFSTGAHTHEQDKRVTKKGRELDVNDANGSFNPLPYASGVPAQVVGTWREILARIALRLIALTK